MRNSDYAIGSARHKATAAESAAASGRFGAGLEIPKSGRGGCRRCQQRCHFPRAVPRWDAQRPHTTPNTL